MIEMPATDLYIPIDKEISQFLQHLRAHPRTILSAKFGDGKSFFLDKFAKDENVINEYKVIKIYPINYQVVGDNDIFSLLKYDVLLQLLVEDMVSEEAFQSAFENQEDKLMMLSLLFEGFAKVDPSPKAQIPSATLRLFKSVANVRKKRSIFQGGDRAARTLLQKLERNNSLYLEDATTRLIRQSLSEWRQREKKRVVLIVEDLDRLDPQHLFRILNVFSAHMDYIYRNGDTPTDSLLGSRFGFDSIVFVLEFENLRRLFAHFYGDETSFGGYISKFIPQGYFEYSLRKSANSYFYDTINRITGIDQVHISGLLGSKMNDISLRDMAYAVKDIESQVTLHSTPSDNYGFLLMIAIMRRLGMGVLPIVQACESLFQSDTISFVRYIIDFSFLEGFSDRKGKIKVDDTTVYGKVSFYQVGSESIRREPSVPRDMKKFDMHRFVSRLLEFVVP